MNRAFMFVVVLFCLFSMRCSIKKGQDAPCLIVQNDTIKIPLGVKALMDVYPDFIKGYEQDSLLLANGTRMVYDDGKEKTFEGKLNNADPEDMFSFIYDRTGARPGYLQDAGRSRCEALFKMMYGNSEEAVRWELVPVEWFGEQVLFTPINGAADSLRAVAKDIATLPEFAKLHPYLKSAGSFYWRMVRGANRLSAHSYGIALDVGVEQSDYWLWRNPGKSETDKIEYTNHMPCELVEIFERHGFIWGGRWYHYDTMHFEFRPELLVTSLCLK